MFFLIVTLCSRRCGSSRNIKPELAVETPPLMEQEEKTLAYFKLKWKGQYGQDRGFSGFTVQWWCLKAQCFGNVGGTVVTSISAIVLSLALCTCQRHCSLSQDKCWFCFMRGKPRQQRFDSWNGLGLGMRACVTADVQIPLTCLLFSFTSQSPFCTALVPLFPWLLLHAKSPVSCKQRTRK